MERRRRSRLSLAAVIEQLSLKNSDKETCDICQLEHATLTCPLIANKICVADSAAPAKAFSSLPSSLLECVSLGNGGHKIVAKQRIAKGTQFGPLEAPRSAMNPRGVSGRLELKLFQCRELECYLDTSDKSLCNWMILVRHSPKQNNLICYQLRHAVYFTAISDISAGEELLVNYSPGYAALVKPSNNGGTVHTHARGAKQVKQDIAEICARLHLQKAKKAGIVITAARDKYEGVGKPEAIIGKRRPTVDRCTETDPEPEPVKLPPVTVTEAGVETDSILVEHSEIETQTEVAISTDAATDVPSPASQEPELEFADAAVGDGEEEEDRLASAEIETQTEDTILADAATDVHIPCPITSPKASEPDSEPELVDLVTADEDVEDDDVIVYEMVVEEPDEPETHSELREHVAEAEELGKEHEVESENLEPEPALTLTGDESPTEVAVMEVETEPLHEEPHEGVAVKEREEPSPESPRPKSPEPDSVDWVCKFCNSGCDSIPSFCLHLIEHYKQVGAARTEKARLKPRKRKQTRKRKRVTRSCRARSSSTSEESSSDEDSTDSEEESSDEIGLGPTPRFPYTCDLCLDQKIFNRGEYIIRHLKLHEAGRLIQEEDLTQAAKDKRAPSKSKCRTCSKSISLAAFKMHTSICSALRLHARDSKTRITCPVCVSSFKQVDEFRDHVVRHTHPYKCGKCERRLKLRAEIIDHTCTPFDCDDLQCGGEGQKVKFLSVSMLQTHLQAKHTGVNADMLYFCYECCLPFSLQATLESHLPCGAAVAAAATATAEERVSKTRLPPPPPRKSKAMVSLVKVSASTKSAPVTSPTTPPEGRARKKSKNTNAEGCYVCEKCGVTYVSWNSMKTHRKTHGSKRFKCDKCGKSFHRKDLLLGHEFTHKEPAFICEQCGKKFKSKKSLAFHAQIHTGVKRFACTECDAAFTQKINLLTHQKIHLPIEQRGFQCKICSKYFSSKEYLVAHLQAHEKGKQFACSICGMKFFKRKTKQRHEKLVHTTKGAHICEFCPLRVKQALSLQTHLRKYHAELKEKWSAPAYVKSRFDAEADTPKIQNWNALKGTEEKPKSNTKSASRSRPSPRASNSVIDSEDEEDSDSDFDLESEFSEVVECEGGPRFDMDLYESEDEEIEEITCPEEYNVIGAVPESDIASIKPTFLRPPPPLMPVAATRTDTSATEQAEDSQFQGLVIPPGTSNSIWLLDADGQNGVILEINDALIGMHDFVAVPPCGN